ncbi:MAG: uroporphyrinogen decarboxylase family protein [Candidatus Thorarchaeota archaeon]
MKPIKEEAMTSVERMLTAMDLKEPDRVPVWPLIDFMQTKYLDHITAQDMLNNPEKAQEAMEWIYHKMGGFDIAMAGGGMYMQYVNPFPDMFSVYYLDWQMPGRQLDPNVPPQLAERALSNPFLRAEDYDRILNEGFFWLANFNNYKMSDMMKLRKIAPKIVEYTIKWWEHYQVPTFNDGAGSTVFDLLSTFRGSTNFMKDIYRYKDKIIEICDKYTDDFIRMGEYGITQSQGKTLLVGAVRASADFISIKHFEELFWPYFKKTVSTYVKKGYIIQMHMDTDWTDRLHYLLELPKGKIYLHMDERTDIFKAKEILGGHICIEGNLKPSLFTIGTPNMIEKQVKKIIDECADGGGLIVGSEIPDNAKLENLKALCDTCKSYGLYRK